MKSTAAARRMESRPELGPGADDFTGRDRDLRFLLDALDGLDEFVDREAAAVKRFITDHDRDDVAVPAGKFDAGANLALVAYLGLFSLFFGECCSVRVLRRLEPDAERNLEAELGRNRRQGLPVRMHGLLVRARGELAVGRCVGADRAGIRCERAEVGAHLLGRRPGILAARPRVVRHAGERFVDVGGDLPGLQQSPHAGMQTRGQRDYHCDGAHLTRYRGARLHSSGPVP